MNKNPTRNASGYRDFTAYHAIRTADRSVKKNNRKKSRKAYPRIYICSPFSGDIERNTENAVKYARFALKQRCFPIAPHLYLPAFMDDAKPKERELALSFGLRFLRGCKEIWVFGNHISAGMEGEIIEARRKRIKIRYFDVNCKEIPNTI
ncbi:MAG: DUF4406 domain-containing protein [Defluviitaleaceae bacterium]|nr:DUF4406 domain-containing protein [Defluviitaleaceae bacterium]